MKNTFKNEDPVTVQSGSNWLIGERGYVVKIFNIPVRHLPERDQNSNIAVIFPHIPLYLFNSHLDDTIPKEQRRWVYFEAKHLVLGHKPLTEEEQIEQELQGFGHSMRPWAGLHSFREQPDHTCVCKGCNNVASKHIWINVWGSGYRAHVCAAHAKKYGLHSCRDNIPFTVKEVQEKAA